MLGGTWVCRRTVRPNSAALRIASSLASLLAPSSGCGGFESLHALSARYVHPSEDAVLAAISRLGGHNSRHTEQKQPAAALEIYSQLMYSEPDSRSGEVLEWPNRAAC